MAASWFGIILIGFLAGLVARLLSRDPRNPQGCLLTTFVGICGAILFTWLGRQTGMYDDSQGAGFIGATIGAIIVLALWRSLVGNR